MVVQAKTKSDFWTLPLMIFFFFKILFYQKSCKEVMNIGVGQSRGGFFFTFCSEKVPFFVSFGWCTNINPYQPCSRAKLQNT